MNVKVKISILSAIVVITVFAVLFASFSLGIIKLNNPSESKYPVRGVDVSSYQGDINWDVLTDQGINFAFIKATEGSAYKDAKFDENWKNAQQTDLYIGAYHFFSYDSSGKTQAENFISTVTPADNMLPPVIDIEYYGEYNKSPKKSEEVQSELSELLNLLEDHYKAKPIIYATIKSYNMYISGNFSDYPIWIRNVFTSPKLSDGNDWLFWQYTDRGRLNGYNGDEKFIDLNVFNGSADELKNLCLRSHID